MTLKYHKEAWPCFVVGDIEDQLPLYVVTVLSINEEVGDCAAYRGITTTFSYGDDERLEKIRAGGSKIRESEARELFDEIETMNLRYRK
jgi:hypothetical protein